MSYLVLGVGPLYLRRRLGILESVRMRNRGKLVIKHTPAFGEILRFLRLARGLSSSESEESESMIFAFFVGSVEVEDRVEGADA